MTLISKLCNSPRLVTILFLCFIANLQNQYCYADGLFDLLKTFTGGNNGGKTNGQQASNPLGGIFGQGSGQGNQDTLNLFGKLISGEPQDTDILGFGGSKSSKRLEILTGGLSGTNRKSGPSCLSTIPTNAGNILNLGADPNLDPATVQRTLVECDRGPLRQMIDPETGCLVIQPIPPTEDIWSGSHIGKFFLKKSSQDGDGGGRRNGGGRGRATTDSWGGFDEPTLAPISSLASFDYDDECKPDQMTLMKCQLAMRRERCIKIRKIIENPKCRTCEQTTLSFLMNPGDFDKIMNECTCPFMEMSFSQKQITGSMGICAARRAAQVQKVTC